MRPDAAPLPKRQHGPNLTPKLHPAANSFSKRNVVVGIRRAASTDAHSLAGLGPLCKHTLHTVYVCYL